MTQWVERIQEERRRALARREIDAAVEEVKGYIPDRVAIREWYSQLLQRVWERSRK